MLNAHPELVNNVMGSRLNGQDIMETAGKQGMLVPQLIYLMADAAPWLVGILSVCALAAMQSTGAAYMSTAGGMLLTRDIVKRFIMPNANHKYSKNFRTYWCWDYIRQHYWLQRYLVMP